MHLLSRPRRPARNHEWDAAKAVTFIVTLAATGSVTLAARRSGMSRKSAYALKERDPAFAAAWQAAASAREGNEADKVDTPPLPRPKGNAARPNSPCMLAFRRQFAEQQRDLFFARLAGACAPAVDK